MLQVLCNHCGASMTPLVEPGLSPIVQTDHSLRVTCESCCEVIVVTVDDINEAQHQLLVALGEA